MCVTSMHGIKSVIAVVLHCRVDTIQAKYIAGMRLASATFASAAIIYPFKYVTTACIDVCHGSVATRRQLSVKKHLIFMLCKKQKLCLWRLHFAVRYVLVFTIGMTWRWRRAGAFLHVFTPCTEALWFLFKLHSLCWRYYQEKFGPFTVFMQCYDSVTVVRGLDEIGGRGGVCLDYCSRGRVKCCAEYLRWIGCSLISFRKLSWRLTSSL